MRNDSYWAPVVIKLKNQEKQEIEINSLSIFYIEVSKEIKTFHLTESANIDDTERYEIYWRTRKYGIKQLLDLLGSKGFIQINKSTVIRNVYISGRDADWKYIYITMPYKSQSNESIESFRNIALPLGRSFATQIKNHVFENLITVKNKDGDIFFISPLDIDAVELSRGNKKLYLNKPVCRYDKNNYVLYWQNRKAFEELILKKGLEWFVRVHRKFYVRIDYPFTRIKEGGKYYLKYSKETGKNNERKAIFHMKIPIGNEFKKSICEIFKETH